MVFAYYLKRSPTGTPSAFAIFSSVSTVGFGLSPVSIFTTVFKAISASFERRSCEIPFFCRSLRIFSLTVFAIINLLVVNYYNILLILSLSKLAYYNDSENSANNQYQREFLNLFRAREGWGKG